MALMVLAMSISLVGNATAAPLPAQFYQGNAYGSFANVGHIVQSGQSSPVGLPCAPPAGPGFHVSRTTATVNVPNLLQTGLIDTSIATGPATGDPQTTSTADVHDASALSGLVSASEVKALSTTWVNSTGYHVRATGSSIVGLIVAGKPILVTPAPNTTITLPGVGKVVLNEQITRITSTSASLAVNMIHITVTNALPGVPAGTQIIVAHATSGLKQNANNSPTLTGGAFSALGHVGTVITAGQEFPVSFCGSTGGQTKTNSALGTNIPGIESSGTATNSVNGTLGTPTSTSVSTATIQNVNLLSSLVTADAVKAEANASLTGEIVSLNETGSTFTNLVVGGQAIAGNVAPNTKINLGGITVWLNRVIQTSRNITVRMIEVSVTGANPQGLPIGSDIQVANASAGAYPAP
jgi:hypothetical protein